MSSGYADKWIEGRNNQCCDANYLHDWVKLYCSIDVPRSRVCPGHAAPFDYLCSSYFEPARDLIVWAPRGGAKTRLGAVATLLDLCHKPGISVRILGGSLEQSLRMWEHLLPDLVASASDLLLDPQKLLKKFAMTNASSAAVLTQSQKAVRGLRVQKLRCDEVEQFDAKVWEAAQLATRSRTCGETHVRGVVEAISTFHNPYGLMSKAIEAAEKPGSRMRVLKWCLLEVLERCPAERACGSCELWDDCQGVAKEKCDGYFPIEDAITMKKRVSLPMWQSEMLCRKPNTRGCVFPTFDTDVHVKPAPRRSTPAR